MKIRKRIISDTLRTEIAKELGVFDTVSKQGWGAVSSRDCGRIVQKAIEIASRNFK